MLDARESQMLGEKRRFTTWTVSLLFLFMAAAGSQFELQLVNPKSPGCLIMSGEIRAWKDPRKLFRKSSAGTFPKGGRAGKV